MATIGVDVPAPGFGSSDCRCRSHLVRVSTARGVRDLLRGLTTTPRGLRLQSMKSSWRRPTGLYYHDADIPSGMPL